MIPIPALPTGLDITSFTEKLTNSGIDPKLKAIVIK